MLNFNICFYPESKLSRYPWYHIAPSYDNSDIPIIYQLLASPLVYWFLPANIGHVYNISNLIIISNFSGMGVIYNENFSVTLYFFAFVLYNVM